MPLTAILIPLCHNKRMRNVDQLISTLDILGISVCSTKMYFFGILSSSLTHFYFYNMYMSFAAKHPDIRSGASTSTSTCECQPSPFDKKHTPPLQLCLVPVFFAPTSWHTYTYVQKHTYICINLVFLVVAVGLVPLQKKHTNSAVHTACGRAVDCGEQPSGGRCSGVWLFYI